MNTIMRNKTFFYVKMLLSIGSFFWGVPFKASEELCSDLKQLKIGRVIGWSNKLEQPCREDLESLEDSEQSFCEQQPCVEQKVKRTYSTSSSSKHPRYRNMSNDSDLLRESVARRCLKLVQFRSMIKKLNDKILFEIEEEEKLRERLTLQYRQHASPLPVENRSETTSRNVIDEKGIVDGYAQGLLYLCQSMFKL